MSEEAGTAVLAGGEFVVPEQAAPPKSVLTSDRFTVGPEDEDDR